ncbi:hypothetical protein G7Y89_g7081 [Cudoniella acicularis]|uniref:Uncharacterized protein n=1 Tax=Cudoniella acicularis TaxID=354080 RepID=A0A8H4W457_9HELO|nr:hypothetical protein G7Y89_g7081 [Cudoniella acicularis]
MSETKFLPFTLGPSAALPGIWSFGWGMQRLKSPANCAVLTDDVVVEASANNRQPKTFTDLRASSTPVTPKRLDRVQSSQ